MGGVDPPVATNLEHRRFTLCCKMGGQEMGLLGSVVHFPPTLLRSELTLSLSRRSLSRPFRFVSLWQVAASRFHQTLLVGTASGICSSSVEVAAVRRTNKKSEE